MNDPLGLGNFNPQALHTPTGPAVKVAKATPPRPGLLGRIASSVVQAPKYFLNTDIVNPGKELLAQATGNKQAFNNAQAAQNAGIGATPTEAIKRLAGNTAQLAGMAVAPEGEGLAARTVAGARGGALVGGGSALANNQNILKGAGLGALGGAALAPAASVAGKALGIGGKVANTALTGKIGSAVSDVAENAPKPTIGQKLTNAVINKGNKIEQRLGSFAPGQKVGGTQLDAASSDKILQTAHNEGIDKLGADSQLRQTESKINELGQTHGSLTDTHNAPVTDEDKQAIQAEIQDRLNNPNNPNYRGGGSSPTVQKYTQEFNTDIDNSDDLSALGRQKSNLDNNQIKYGGNLQAAVNARNLAAKTSRNVINDFMNSKIPGLSGVNSRLSGLYDLKGALMNASGSQAGKTTGAEGIFGRLLTSETAEQAKGAFAKGLQKTGTALGGKGSATEPILGDINAPAESGTMASGATPPPTTPTAVSAAVKAPSTASSILGSLTGAAPNVARLGVAGALGNPPAQTPDQSLSATDIANTITPAQTPPTQASESEDSPYPEENMLYDIENDPKNASTYESLYTLLNPKPSASATSLDATQQKEVAAGESAINRLQQYGQQLTTALGKNETGTGGLYALLGRDLPGKLTSSGMKDAAALQSGKRDVAIQLATALSGGTKPSSQSVEEIEGSLPDVKDSQEEINDKINSIVSGIQRNLQTYATPVSQLAAGITGQQTTNGSVGSNLDSLLGSLSGAQ